MKTSQRAIRFRKRLRSSERGAAFVEALVVAGMLMTMMAGGLFLHRLYAAQHNALEDARLAAWSSARKGCSSGFDVNAVWSDVGQNNANIDVESEEPPGFFGAVAHTSGSASRSVNSQPRASGGSYTLRATDTVACDEIPVTGDTVALVGHIATNLLPSF